MSQLYDDYLLARDALVAMLEDYSSEGCPDPDYGVCRRSKAAEQKARAVLAKAGPGAHDQYATRLDLKAHANDFVQSGLWSYTGYFPGYFPDDFYGKEGERYYRWSKRAYDLISRLDAVDATR